MKRSLDAIVELIQCFPRFLTHHHRASFPPHGFHWGQEVSDAGLGDHRFRFAGWLVELSKRQDIVFKSVEFSEEVAG